MTQPTQTFGGRLRAARLRRFLTQKQLAALVGVDWRVVQRWESDRARPYPRNLERLCAALGVSYDELALD
jgi:transcriptional regulator with XRE-family HTH domain